MKNRKLAASALILLTSILSLTPSVLASDRSTQSSYLIAQQPNTSSEEKYQVPKLQLKHMLKEQQQTHDKAILDRFLLSVSVIFVVISFLLLISLPPKPREQGG